MKKICHISSAHNRYDVRIFEKECTSLAKNGFDVYYVVNDTLDNETKQGVHIISTNYIPKNRKQRMIDSMQLIYKKAIEIDAEIYHLHDPELLQLVNKLKKRGKKIIFDAHEDTAVQIMDKEWLPLYVRKFVSKLYLLFSKYMLSKCDGVISVTPAIVDKMKEYNTCVEMITNYPILEEKKCVESLKVQVKDDYLFFAGGISKQWCHDRIAKAIERIDGIQYILAGPVDDEYKKELSKFINTDKIILLGKIPHNQVEMYYKNALAGVAVNDCSQIKGEGTLGNTKLFEIMASGIPVVATDYKLWKEIIEGNQCGICVDSSDVDSIHDAILHISSNKELARIMGENGKRAVEIHYNWTNEEKKLFDFYQRI